jgi:hypothetical protein
VRLLTYRDINTLIDFLVAYKQRLGSHYFAYFLTVDFAKEDEHEFLKRFYTLKRALNYVYVRDRTVIAIAREERYPDGRGFHAHILVITRAYVNFEKFLDHARRHALLRATFNMRYVEPQVENVLRVLAYVVKSREEVARAWEIVSGQKIII